MGTSRLVQSAARLEAIVAEHRRLLEEVGAMPGALPDRREEEVRETLLECIHVLEETRHSFKSRRLAELRRKLIRKLAEFAP